jgi:hypothetical protein
MPTKDWIDARIFLNGHRIREYEDPGAIDDKHSATRHIEV